MKTNNLGFRPSLTQTGMHSHRRRLEVFAFAYADCWFSHAAAHFIPPLPTDFILHLTSLQHASLQHSFVYNTDHCWTPIGHFRLFLLCVYTFYSQYNTDWIANTEISLDPINSVIKRLWCIDQRGNLVYLHITCFGVRCCKFKAKSKAAHAQTIQTLTNRANF